MASPRAASDATPICRCRVLYLGSSVPHITKDGLQGIQEPLRELYPEQGASGARGIDSWLSVWSNGLLLENVDENHKKVTRFFPIESLHYCAAVRYVMVQPPNNSNNNPLNTSAPPRFLPLDSPFARSPNLQHPPLFAAILRRTTGIKVLECHAFICKREMSANALVKCCFHAYADASYAKQIDAGSKYSTLIKPAADMGPKSASQSVLGEAASSIEKVEGWRTTPPIRTTNGHHENGGDMTLRSESDAAGIDDISIYNGDENHKVWAGHEEYSASTLRSTRSAGGMRSARPRQIVAPAKTPPPPPVLIDDDAPTLKKNKKLKSKKSREEFVYAGHPHPAGMPLYNGTASLMRPVSRHGPHSVNGGTLMRPGSAFDGANATLMRPVNGYGPPPPPVPHGPPVILIQGRPMPPQGRMFGTFSHRPKHMPKGMPGPFLAPLPPPPMPMSKKQLSKYYQQHQEEPIYMPSSARPLSPVASYQPGHFPHDAYMHQMMPPPSRSYTPAAGYAGPAYIPAPMEQPATLIRPTNTKKRSKSKKEERGEDGESPFNTGIYRKKGHLNERAFSYSIRQEHRSRSYGSLASLKFSENGTTAPSKEDAKKEREIMQMMHDLEMSGDELTPRATGTPMNGNAGYEHRNRAAPVGRR